jgi:hypothetical protein
MNQTKHATMQADDRILRQCAGEIRSLARRSVEDIIMIGRLLTDVKKRLAHGRWLPRRWDPGLPKMCAATRVPAMPSGKVSRGRNSSSRALSTLTRRTR